jgi:Uma2 family endonuclease
MARKKSVLRYENIGELLHDLGDIPPERVRLDPLPGQATERDLLRLNDHGSRLYELVDGVLVEKPMGYKESYLATRIGRYICQYAEDNDLGAVTGADGTHRILPGIVRLPDVAYASWERFPNRELPDAPIPDLAPDLAVEVLSESNTKGEIRRKLKEYFLAGVRLVWVVDPKKRTVQVYTAPDESLTLTESQALDGGDVLPGLKLPLRTVFVRIPASDGRSKPRRRKGGAA